MYYVEPYVYYYQINYRDNESRFLLPDIINATEYPVYSTQSIDASRFENRIELPLKAKRLLKVGAEIGAATGALMRA